MRFPARHPPRSPGSTRSAPPHLIPPLIIAITLAVCLLAPGTAHPQDCITELAVIHGGNSSISPPAGFSRISVDLNAGAGGDFVYLCYRRGIGTPITGLAVTVNNGAPPSSAYSRIDVDLNVGCGGDTDYIWLWYTRDPACTTLRDLHVQADSSDPPTGFTRINVDLNRGAHGAFVYLSYRKQ